MKQTAFYLLSLLVLFLATGCAAPQSGSSPQGRTYQPQQGSFPPRGGYEEQIEQEQDAENRKAAGELLPALMELQNQMIIQQNKGR